MKKIFTFLLICFSFNSFSQSYPSIFGKDSSQWNYFVECYDIFYTDIFTAKNKTDVNGTMYFELYGPDIDNSDDNQFLGYIREDTLLGQVYYMNKDSVNEHIIVNFNLHVDDTISYFFETDFNLKYKVIYTNDSIIAVDNDLWGIQFVKRIGLAQSLYTYEYGYKSELLCMYKDGVQVYQNDYFTNTCEMNGGTYIHTVENKYFELYQTKNLLQIESKGEDKPIYSVVIYDMLGIMVFQSHKQAQQMLIPIHNLEAGIYFVRINDSVFKKIRI